MSSVEEKELKAGHPPAGNVNNFESVTIEMNVALYARFSGVKICQQKLQMVAMALFSHVLRAFKNLTVLFGFSRCYF